MDNQPQDAQQAAVSPEEAKAKNDEIMKQIEQNENMLNEI